MSLDIPSEGDVFNALRSAFKENLTAYEMFLMLESIFSQIPA